MRIVKVLVLVLLFGTVSVFAQTSPPTPSGNQFGNLWFVELTRAPLADVDARFTAQQRANYVAQLRADKQAFRNAASAAGVQFRERRAFDVLWNGLSVEVNPAQLSRLSRVPGVSNLYPVGTASIPTTQSLAQPELATALAMTGADVAQSELGLTGAGIKVAVIDTGIDYDHRDLGGDGVTRLDSADFPTSRVVAGWDFVGDAFNADPTSPAFNPEPAPDPRPDDCNGHGTHVAGIVGASPGSETGAKGVAPGVRFGAYRVFGCAGSTTFDIIIAAMERALTDGMHVVNMSLGAAFQWPQHPAAQASDRLVNKGVVVVASIGNSGASGVYSAGVPGVGSKVIGVASYDNTHFSALTFTVNPSGRQVPYLPLATTPGPPTSGTTPQVVFVGRGCIADAYLGDPNGKVALIERGLCTFNEKYNRAADAGAVGVLIHNNVAGLFAGGGVVSRDIFGVGISQADGLHIRAQAGPTITWTDVRVSAPNPTGGLISSFSSYGLSPDLAFKPDIGAPGGLIRSTYPLERGGYAIISGTSMSSPHVAGGVALLLQAKPRTPAQAVMGILQNAADPKVFWGAPTSTFIDNAHRQGAGMLDIPGSVGAGIGIEPSKLALGESEAGPATRTLTIRNNTNNTVTYALSHAPALSTGGSTFTPGFFTGFASVAFSTTSVTLLAQAQATVDVTITANPGLPDGSQYGGYIVLRREATGEVYRVPYGGFKGDYQAIVPLVPTSAAFPWLAKRVATNLTSPLTDWQNQPGGATFTFAGADVPWILFHLNHQVRRVRAEVLHATTGASVGRAFEFQYVGRNGTANPDTFFAVSWDGRAARGVQVRDVANGTYVLVLSVQKALGQDEVAAHWQSWTSPVITINRPAP